MNKLFQKKIQPNFPNFPFSQTVWDWDLDLEPMVVVFTGTSPGVDRHGGTASAHTGMGFLKNGEQTRGTGREGWALGSLSLIFKGYARLKLGPRRCFG